MELIVVFFWMAVIATGVAMLSAGWGWWNIYKNNWQTAENAFKAMIDAGMTAGGFALLAFIGLLFV